MNIKDELKEIEFIRDEGLLTKREALQAQQRVLREYFEKAIFGKEPPKEILL